MKIAGGTLLFMLALTTLDWIDLLNPTPRAHQQLQAPGLPATAVLGIRG